MTEPCPECQGKTIKFRGIGADLQYWLCPRKDEPGHLTREEANELFQKQKMAHLPAKWRRG